MTLAADAPWEAAMSELLQGLKAPQGVQDRLLTPEDDPATAAQREMLRTILRAAANAGQENIQVAFFERVYSAPEDVPDGIITVRYEPGAATATPSDGPPEEQFSLRVTFE
jgi:hypothetical protein